MPIRTPRGRSAAYRAIWQWPLRSPARLAAVVLAVLVVVAGVSYGFAALAGDGAGRAAAPSTTPSTVTSRPPSGAGAAPSGTATPSALPPVAELTPGTLPPGSAPAAALQVATQWANAWVNHPAGTTSAQWVERLRPYTTDEYLVVLGGVDPANVPANRVTGPARAVRYSPKSVQVEVPTDALTLQVLVVEGDTGWKVAGHDRVGQ